MYPPPCAPSRRGAPGGVPAGRAGGRPGVRAPHAGPLRLGALAAASALAACLMAAPPAHALEADTRIVDGSTSATGSWPWAAAIHTFGLGHCTGTLIAPRWALTAAHCLEVGGYPQGTVTVGNIDRNAGNVIPWESAHPHPGFARHLAYLPTDDIALLYLERAATTSLANFALADADIQTRLVNLGSFATGIGWGSVERLLSLRRAHDILQEAEFEIRHGNQCNFRNSLNQPYWNPSLHVCSGRVGQTSLCSGDSGGPLMVQEGGTWYQVGVANAAEERCDGRSIHTQVAVYRDWIAATMAAELDIDSPSVAEGALGSTTTLTFTVTTTRTSPEEVRVGWGLFGGDAMRHGDYQSDFGGTVTIPANMNSATFTVAVIGDDTIENDETVVVRLENPSGARIRTGIGTGTITNDDMYTVPTFVVDSPRANEGAPELRFTVRLAPAPLNNDVVFRYTVTGVTAMEGVDYQPPAAATGTIPMGQETATIPVVLIDNNAVGGSRTMEVFVADPTGGGIRGSFGTGTILDDDRVISVASPGVAEGGPGDARTLPFMVRLDQSSPDDVTVDWRTTGGTAADGGDYEAASGTITFTDGGPTTQTARVTVTGDNGFEPNETVEVTFSNALGATLATSTATGTIRNDDLPGISISTADVPEGAAGDTTTLVFTVTLSETLSEDVAFGYAVRGTATAVDDFAPPSGTVTVPANMMSAAINVAVVADDVLEPDETVVVELTSVNGLAIPAGTAVATSTIQRDESGLSIDSPSVDEGTSGTTPTLTFTVMLEPAAAGTVTVQYRVTGGTAAADDDYAAVADGTLTFTAGETEKTIPVTVTGDNVSEPDETVLITLSAPTGAAGILPGRETGTGTIRNDDLPRLTIGSPSVDEGALGDSPTLEFEVALDRMATGTVTVDWSTTGGTATAGEDYTAANGMFTFAPGDTMRTARVTVRGDDGFELDETVEVTLSNAVGAAIATSTGTGAIRNDDVPGVSISAADVPEGAMGDTTMLVFTVMLFETPSESVTFEYAVRGSAMAGADFTAPSGTVTVATGTRSATIGIEVVADDVFEPDETVVVELTSANGIAIPAGTAVATGTIGRDEPGLSIDSPSVDEGAAGTTTTLTFTVTLEPAAAGTVTVQYGVTGGTATAGDDYAAVADGMLTFTAGVTEQTIPVTVTGDDVNEPDERVLITLSAPTGGAEILPGRETGTGTIRNDERPRLTIGSPSVDEGARGDSPTLGFAVELDRAATGTVTVDWSTTGGTATAGDDYTAANGTFTFAAGDTMRTARVTVRGDDEFEPHETVEVTLSDASGAMIATSTGTGTIRNDDLPEVSISAPDVQEGAQGATTSLVFTVTLSEPAAATTTFQYVVKGTATAGSDFTAPSGTVTIPPGRTSATIEIVVTADDVFEPDETVVIELTSANGVAIPAGRETGTATIERDEPGLSIDSPSVAEGASGTTATLEFTVTLDPPAAGTVTVQYATVAASSTATAGEDYAPASGTLTFDPGDTEKTFPVTVNGDDEGEPDETVVVRLSGETGGAGILQGTGTGTIRNDDTDSRAQALANVLAGVGRTIATNFVDLVWDRVDAHRSGNDGPHATVGGRHLDAGAFAGGGPEGGAALRAGGGLAKLLGVRAPPPGALLRDAGRRYAAGGGLGALRDWVDLPDDRDLVGRTRFALPFAGHDGGRSGSMAVWGRGSLASFESGLKHDGFSAFSAEGEVASGHLGIEYRSGELLAGVALGRSVGDVDYRFEDGSESRGNVKTELTSAHPYLHWMSPAGLGVWGAVGYGAGKAELEDGDGRIETDIAMEMAAVGVRGEFGHAGNLDLAVKADAFMARTTADEVEGGDLLREVTADSSRARLALESSSERLLAGRAVVAGSFELGARLDGGDAEQGAGADIAAAFGYTAPRFGFELRGRGSLLLAHDESDFGEWSLGLGLAWDPGLKGRGFLLSLEPGWGVPAAGSSMWDAGPGRHGAARASGRGAVLNARLGYGMGVWEDRALVTVFGELGRTDGAGRLRLGAGLRRAGAGGPGFELYGENLDRPAGRERQVVLKGRLGF